MYVIKGELRFFLSTQDLIFRKCFLTHPDNVGASLSRSEAFGGRLNLITRRMWTTTPVLQMPADGGSGCKYF